MGAMQVADRFGMEWKLFYDNKLKRVAILVSRMDHCLYDILIRHRAGITPVQCAPCLRERCHVIPTSLLGFSEASHMPLHSSHIAALSWISDILATLMQCTCLHCLPETTRSLPEV